MAVKNTLDITLRTEFGKRANYKLRKEGKIPAVVYGGKEQRYVAIDDREFEKKYHRAPESLIISLMLNGEEQCEVLIKDYQDDILTGKMQHIDFFEITRGVLLKTSIPVYLEGVPAGVKAGGVLEQIVHNIEVECLPRNIPEKIAIDVSGLDMNQALYVKDIPANPDVKLLLDPEEIICHVTHVKEEPVAAPAEGEEAAAAEAAPAEGEAAAADAEKK